MSEPIPNLPEQKRTSYRKWLLPAGLFLLFLIGIFYSYHQTPSPPLRELPQLNPEEPNQPLEPAPDFEMIDLSGNKLKLSDFRGKAVLINFWSITCPACLIELRSLASLSEQLSGKPFALIALTSNSRDEIKEFLDKTGLKLPAYFDPGGNAANKYGVYYLPVSFVIDPQGRVVDQFYGAADWDEPQVITYFQKLIELYQPNKP